MTRPLLRPVRVAGSTVLVRLWIVLALVLLVPGAAGLAQAPGHLPSLVVYPFDSQDVLLGVALADEVAAALHQHAVVLGPDVAPGAIPPVIVEGGFVSLGRAIGAERFVTPVGADLLRTGTGVDVAATGRVELRDSGAVLRLSVAYDGGTRNADLTAELATPERLAALAAALIRGILDDVAGTRGETPVVLPAPPSLVGDFSGTPYGGYARAVALISAGLLEDALVELNELVGVDGAPARAATLQRDLADALAPGHRAAPDASPSSVARVALLSIAATSSETAAVQDAFAAMSAATGLALGDVWQGTLAANVNDRVGAQAALDRGADGFFYGQAVRASFLQTRGDAGFTAELDRLTALGPAAGSAALLGVSVIAELSGDTARQKAALVALTRAAPFMTYPLDRLSHIYFDEDDGRSAAEVLAVAVDLEPDSDLYWTNLGWAYYLTGALDASEAASQRALELDGSQEVAAYNLGLVRSVTGRLDEAMRDYRLALRLDPTVNDDAIVDLERARDLYPGQSAVDYALATLYEAKGRRTDARRAFERFVRLAAADDAVLAPYVASARERIAVLAAPLPPLVQSEVSLTLGSRGVASQPFHPGDPVFPSFELTTPGDELPGTVDVTLALLGGSGDEPIKETHTTVTIPPGAVGFVVDTVELVLPSDLAAGAYRVRVDVDGDEGQSASRSADLEVAGGPDRLRQLLGRSLVMTAFDSGRPLYSAADLGGERFLATLVAELRSTAELAEQALPLITSGRFAGLGGGKVFSESSESDVKDFLDHLLASQARDSRFTFVDAYAQWAIDGAPAGETSGE